MQRQETAQKGINLSDHFTFGKLLRFVAPTVAMMLFTSIYYVVDGIFVSAFAGHTAFAAINLVMPYIMALSAVGFMFGTGGAALVGKLLGEGEKDRAQRTFSLIVYTTIIAGIIISAAAAIALPYVLTLMKAEGEMYDLCLIYGYINIWGNVTFMLQNVFQSFFVTAEKPKLGFLVIVGAGVTNAVLDAVFIAGLRLGVVGAAIATVLGQTVGGVLPIIYFANKNNGSLLRLRECSFDGKALLISAGNGSSEMLTNLSGSLVNILYNYQLMRLAGESGVAAYGFMMYVGYIFISVFLGYCVGAAPIISFNLGAGNKRELANVTKKSFIILAAASAIMFGLAEVLNYPLCLAFVGSDPCLVSLTANGFGIFAFLFLLCGFNIFTSGFFTALNNGLVSAICSFLRTLVFQTAMVMLLPEFWGMDGVWLSAVAADILTNIVCISLLIGMRKKYGY